MGTENMSECDKRKKQRTKHRSDYFWQQWQMKGAVHQTVAHPTVSAKLWLVIKKELCRSFDSEFKSELFVWTAFKCALYQCKCCHYNLHKDNVYSFYKFLLLLVFRFTCKWHFFPMVNYLVLQIVLFNTWILWNYCRGEMLVKHLLTFSFGCILIYFCYVCSAHIYCILM